MTTVPSWLPLAAFAGLAASTGFRLAQMRRHDGRSALVLRSGDNPHAFLGRVLGGMTAAMAVFCVCLAARPTATTHLGALAWLEQPVVGWTGALLAVAGALLAGAAQFGMGASWRIGIPANERTALATSGLYSLSRNPIYVGMLAAVAGTFLMAPNAVSAALFAVAATATALQVRLEEEFLLGLHGEAYETYRKRTRRWL